MRAIVQGLGIWRPKMVRRNDAWSKDFLETARSRGDRTLVDIPPSRDELDRITLSHLLAEARDPFLGARERRVAGDEPSWWAELRAAEAALRDAGVDAVDVDAILSWAIVPDRPVLPSATRVAHELGANGAWSTGVDSGCASALIQLDMATALIESGRARHVLLTQSHLITRAFPMSHPASPCVGDCATAMLVGASERRGVLGVQSASHGEYWDAITWTRESEATQDSPWWTGGGPYSPGSCNREAARNLMMHTVRFGVDTVREACERWHVPVGEIDALAAVQPRGWIPPSIAEGLGLAPEIAPTTYSELAHVGGCGVVANLIACRDAGLLHEGALVALYAQGAGFTRSAALLRW